MSRTKRLVAILDNYAIAPLTGRLSTSGYWYLPQPARIRDAESFSAYKESACPPYFIDYDARLSWPLVGSDGIMRLPYPEPIGVQINPEAAFQYALGAHDSFVISGNKKFQKIFLHYAETFAARQTSDGDWSYEFDWDASRAPWSSALAQSRGASVMLRAGKMTADQNYFASATRALQNFMTPITEGGYLAYHRKTGTPYFEEYPLEPVAVLNGHMAAIFGLWEVGFFLRDDKLIKLADTATDSLVQMLPHYEVSGWTIYDDDPNRPGSNWHSPFYHQLCVEYLDVLKTITGRSELIQAAVRWQNLNTKPRRAIAYGRKLIRKVYVR